MMTKHPNDLSADKKLCKYWRQRNDDDHSGFSVYV
jgi:hypothetical protein